ncbi:MAG: c-type cytochrome [Chloroflexi bacterium]|nr:c-type cytochrome [Chloroflexota bacterium]
MNRWIAVGFIATGVLVLAFGYLIVSEDERQATAAERQQTDDIAAAADVYAINCAACHGAAGEGIANTPSLATDPLRNADAETIHKTISRGLYGTVMAAWSVDEGGTLSNRQVDQLVTLIQHADWDDVANQVSALGYTPPEPETIEVDTAALDQIKALPNGTAIANGLEIYNRECSACHSTELAPPLDTPELRSRLSDAELARIINEGVPGTLMAGWQGALTAQEITDVVTFIRNYDQLSQAGVEMPTAPPPPEIEITPELIADGQKLYDILCTQCHGSIGQGTPLAPALNAQQFLADTPDAAIMQIIAGGVPDTIMPAWSGRLTEADILALTAFIRSWEPTAPPVAQ